MKRETYHDGDNMMRCFGLNLKQSSIAFRPHRFGSAVRRRFQGSFCLTKESESKRSKFGGRLSRSIIGCALGCALLLCVPSGQGSEFSFVGDFLYPPEQSNTPTNVWQYFYRVDIRKRTGYERLPFYDVAIQNSGTEGWRSAVDAPPYVGIHSREDRIFPYFGLGEGHIHPGNDGLGVAIGFNAPSNGVFEVSGSIRAAAGGSINWYLDRTNASTVLAAGRRLQSSQNFFIPRLSLQKGEFLFLIVDNDGDWFADSTAVEFIVRPAKALPTLDISLVTYAGITVHGEIGHPYRVEYLDTISENRVWTALTNFTLPEPSYFFQDPSPVAVGGRIYRVVETP